MNKLQDAISTTASGFKRLTGSTDAYNRSMGFSEDKLKGATRAVEKLNDGMSQFESTAGTHHTIWGKIKGTVGSTTLGLGLFLQGISMLPGAFNRMLGPLREYGFAQMDLARKSMRGTAMMVGSADDVVKSQIAVHTAAIQIRKDTGLSVEESTALASTMGDAYALSADYLKESYDLSNPKIKEYSEMMGETAKLTGLSASAMGEFNKHMMVNLRQSQQERERMLGLIHGVSRFGIKGTEAVKLIEENYTKIMAINKEDRSKFVSMMLESAGIFKKAGVDYAKATEKFKSTGADRFSEAAIMAAFSQGQFTFQQYLNQKVAADFGNEQAKFELLKKNATALINEAHAITGMTFEEARKGIADVTTKGGNLESPEAQKILSTAPLMEIINKDLLKTFGTSWQEVITAKNWADMSYDEYQKEMGKLQPTSKQEMQGVERSNITLDEGIIKQQTAWAESVGLYNVRAIEATRHTLEMAGAMEKLANSGTSAIYGLGTGIAGGFMAGGVLKTLSRWMGTKVILPTIKTATTAGTSMAEGPLARGLTKVTKVPWLGKLLGTAGLVWAGADAMETLFNGEVRMEKEFGKFDIAGDAKEWSKKAELNDLKKSIQEHEEWTRDYANSSWFTKMLKNNIAYQKERETIALKQALWDKSPHNIIFDSPIEHIDKKPPTVIFDSPIEQQKVAPVIEHDDEQFDPKMEPEEQMMATADATNPKSHAENIALLGSIKSILTQMLEAQEKLSDNALHGSGLSYS